jgi:hypothetical protein
MLASESLELFPKTLRKSGWIRLWGEDDTIRIWYFEKSIEVTQRAKCMLSHIPTRRSLTFCSGNWPIPLLEEQLF